MEDLDRAAAPAPSAAQPRRPAGCTCDHLLATDPRSCVVADDGGRRGRLRRAHGARRRRLPLLPLRAAGLAGPRPGTGHRRGLPGGAGAADAGLDLRRGRPARLHGPLRLAGPGSTRADLPAPRRAGRERPARPAGGRARPGPSEPTGRGATPRALERAGRAPAGLPAAAGPRLLGRRRAPRLARSRRPTGSCSATATRTPAAAWAQWRPRTRPACRPCSATWSAPRGGPRGPAGHGARRRP